LKALLALGAKYQIIGVSICRNTASLALTFSQ